MAQTAYRYRNSFLTIRSRSAVVYSGPRKRPGRRLFRGLLLFSALAAAAYFVNIGYEAAGGPNLFTIKHLEITGFHHLSASDLEALIAVDSSMTLLDVDLESIQSNLLAHPLIKEAHVRKTYPGTLVIRVTEREPAAIIEGDPESFWVDKAGRILGKIPFREQGVPLVWRGEIQNISDWPIFRGVEAGLLQEGDAAVHAGFNRAMELLAVVGQYSNRSGSPILVDVQAAEEGVVEWNGYRIRFPETNVREAWERFQFVESDILERKARTKEIDLRFPGQVIVR